VPSNNVRGGRLAQIPGMTPSLLDLPPGCPFRERCPKAMPDCIVTPDVTLADGGDRTIRFVLPCTGRPNLLVGFSFASPQVLFQLVFDFGLLPPRLN